MRVVRGKNKRMVVLQNKISKQSVAALPKVNFEGRIFVVNTEAEARKAISYLNTHSIVGVDTETRPSFKKGTTHKVALLQISTHDTCFLFRLNRLGLPDFLEEFLQNDVLKVGLSLKDDFAMLRKRNTKRSAQRKLGGIARLCSSFRYRGKKLAENLCVAVRQEDF